MAVLLPASLIFIATPAFAAEGEIAGLVMSVSQDGSEPLVSEYDDSLNNGKVAANDMIEWTVGGTVASAGDVTYSAVLPGGMEWDQTSAASSVCNVSGSISSDRRTLTCVRTATSGAESFQIRAWVANVANGAAVAPTVTAGTAAATAPDVAVVGATKAEMRIFSQTFNQATTHNGVAGASFYVVAQPGATTASGNLRGLQALQSPLSFSIAVPDGAVVMSSSMPAGQAGSLNVSQSAPGEDVQVTVTGGATSFLNAFSSPAQPGTYRVLPSTPQFVIFIPNEPTLPPGVVTQVTTQFKNFDPTGLDGTSNFGDGFAEGQSPDYACPASSATGTQLACVVWNVDRRGGLNLAGNSVGATATSGGTLRYLVGDNHAFSNGQEKLVPGGFFGAHMGFGNLSTSSESASNPHACVTFDNSLLNLTGVPAVKKAGNPALATYTGGGTILDSSDYVLEYSASSHADDDARRSADCGIAGDGANGWVSDASELPGGAASATSIRVSSTLVLEPGVSLGLSVPFTRALSDASLALPVNAPIPWFFQYGTAETDVVKSAYPSTGSASVRVDGGYVQAVPTLVRATTSIDTDSMEPGATANIRVNPFIIAPVGEGVETTAENISVTVSLDSTCLNPIPATLDSLVDAGKVESYEITPADPGPDGLYCTNDDGDPAMVTMALGSKPAPSGESDLSNPNYRYNTGHQIDLPELIFGVSAAPLTPSGQTVTATTVIAADTDPSLDYSGTNPNTHRTSSARIVISGVAALSGSKSAQTTTEGQVGPGESFNYLLAWNNGTADDSGVGKFVDLLPYNGDARGTTGIGESGLIIEKVVSSMDNADLMGGVTIQYTTDEPDGIAEALAVANNEDGESGISWQDGELPATGVTALRFVMDGELKSGFSGTATITVKAPELSVGGVLFNDLYGRTGEINNDPATSKGFRAVSPVELRSTAAELSGRVMRDLDLSGAISDADDHWPVAGATVEILDTLTGEVSSTTTLSGNGTFTAHVVPGTYAARLAEGEHDGWAQLLASEVTVKAGESASGADALYGEEIPDPVLEDDRAETRLGDAVTIDVTANDKLYLPSVSQGEYPRDGVDLGDAPTFGTVELADPVEGSEQSQIRYTPPTEWPSEFEGQSSFEDSFTYTWTNALGVSDTANVVVTVRALVPGTFTFSKTSDPQSGATVGVGDPVTYTLRVEQEGELPAHGASIVDDLSGVLDDAALTGDIFASTGSAVVEGEMLRWDGDLEVGASATITYTVEVGSGGDELLQNTVTSEDTRGSCDTRIGCESVLTMGPGMFLYSKQATPAHGSNVNVGDTITYELTVEHQGEGSLKNAQLTDDLSQVLDDAAYNDDVTPTAGEAVVENGILTWNGDLSKGDQVTITYSVTVMDAGDGIISNQVTSSDARGACESDTGCATMHRVAAEDSPVTPGDPGAPQTPGTPNEPGASNMPPSQGGLSVTGGAGPWFAGGLAALLLLSGALLLAARRKRRTESARAA